MRHVNRILAVAIATAFAGGAAAQQSPGAAGQQPAQGQQAQQQQAQQRQAQQQGRQQNQVRVSELRGQQVQSQQGEQLGTIERVVRDQADRAHAVIRMQTGDRQVLAPMSDLSRANGQLRLNVAAQSLREFDQAGGYQEVEPQRTVSLGGQQAGQPQQSQAGQQRPGQQAQAGQQRPGQPSQQEARAGQIVVQQTQPQLHIEQGQPQVRVQQAQPTVSVQQPTPQIIVRQAPPTITVQMPDPEIIVRMPDPQVDVAQAQPQVQVEMPQPQVRVEQPQQQAVPTVQQAQPQVQVLPPQQQAQVQVTPAQPQVQFERTGEPRVVMQQSQGQPNVRIERLDPQQQGQQAQAAQQRQQLTAQQRQQPQDRQAQTATAGGQQPAATASAGQGGRDVQLRERLGVGASASTMPTSGASGQQVRQFMVGEIEGMNVENFRGENLGSVDRVVLAPGDNTGWIVLNHGGFLGIGEEEVALPAERFRMQGNRLVVSGVTEQDLEAIAEQGKRLNSYLRAQEDAQLALIVQQ